MLEKLKNKEIEKITKGPLYFAIAKSFNDQKKYDEAFKYFKLGNEDTNSRVKDKILIFCNPVPIAVINKKTAITIFTFVNTGIWIWVIHVSINSSAEHIDPVSKRTPKNSHALLPKIINTRLINKFRYWPAPYNKIWRNLGPCARPNLY